MLTSVHPKLPMRNKEITRDFYVNQLNFTDISSVDYNGYLLVKKDDVEIHFFDYRNLDPHENYGQVYIRTQDIQKLYQVYLDNKVWVHPNGQLEIKPWGQKEFSILDPDKNLLTFGEEIN